MQLILRVFVLLVYTFVIVPLGGCYRCAVALIEAFRGPEHETFIVRRINRA